MALVDCKQPVFDNQVNEILSMLEEGIDREEIARQLGYTNPVSLDNYMRRRHFSWDSREKMFVPAAERYSPKLRKNILPLHGTSKAVLVISYFDQDGADAKAIAKQVGFETHTELASYMKNKGYTWDTSLENYAKSSEETKIQVNKDDSVTIDDVFELMKKLQGAEIPINETKKIPR